jgi:hypothetical protein
VKIEVSEFSMHPVFTGEGGFQNIWKEAYYHSQAELASIAKASNGIRGGL